MLPIIFTNIYSLIILGAGIIPISKFNNNIYFLLGKDIAYKSWSDFGGKSDKDETRFETAIREGYEELDGFLGDIKTVENEVVNNRILKYTTQDTRHTCYLYKINYSKYLPYYFNNHHKFVKKNTPYYINNNGLYEKDEIKWYSFNELKYNQTDFREYFIEISNYIYNDKEHIQKKMIS